MGPQSPHSLVDDDAVSVTSAGSLARRSEQRSMPSDCLVQGHAFVDARVLKPGTACYVTSKAIIVLEKKGDGLFGVVSFCRLGEVRGVDVVAPSSVRVVTVPRTPSVQPPRAFLTTDAASISSQSFTRSLGVPVLTHVGSGLFRLRNVAEDGITDAHPFAFAQPQAPGRSLASLVGIANSFEMECGSVESAASLKSWLQLHCDHAQRAKAAKPGH